MDFDDIANRIKRSGALSHDGMALEAIADALRTAYAAGRAAGIEESAKVADRFSAPAFVRSITGTPCGKVPVFAEAIAASIRAADDERIVK